MRMKTLKLSIAAVLSAGILFSLVAGITYASETEPYGDHQELQIPVYEESVDVWSNRVVPENQNDLKDALKNPDMPAISADCQVITAAVTIKRPVHFEVVGYDELSSSEQKDLKVKIDLSEKVGGFMTVRGLPREKVDLVNQGSTVIYWDEPSVSSEEPVAEEPSEVSEGEE